MLVQLGIWLRSTAAISQKSWQSNLNYQEVKNSSIIRFQCEYKPLSLVNSQCEYYEDDPLINNVSVLCYFRIDESNQKVLESQDQVTELKQRNAHLEKQMDRLKVENVKGNDIIVDVRFVETDQI